MHLSGMLLCRLQSTDCVCIIPLMWFFFFCICIFPQPIHTHSFSILLSVFESPFFALPFCSSAECHIVTISYTFSFPPSLFHIRNLLHYCVHCCFAPIAGIQYKVRFQCLLCTSLGHLYCFMFALLSFIVHCHHNYYGCIQMKPHPNWFSWMSIVAFQLMNIACSISSVLTEYRLQYEFALNLFWLLSFISMRTFPKNISKEQFSSEEVLVEKYDRCSKEISYI